jgi:prolipoprotein diacylglyceryltransferase
MPMMLICFGIGRFLIEFARDSEKIWLGCSSISFHALFMVIVGVDMFTSIREKEREKAKKKAALQHQPKRRNRK